MSDLERGTLIGFHIKEFFYQRTSNALQFSWGQAGETRSKYPMVKGYQFALVGVSTSTSAPGRFTIIGWKDAGGPSVRSYYGSHEPVQPWQNTNTYSVSLGMRVKYQSMGGSVYYGTPVWTDYGDKYKDGNTDWTWGFHQRQKPQDFAVDNSGTILVESGDTATWSTKLSVPTLKPGTDHLPNGFTGDFFYAIHDPAKPNVGRMPLPYSKMDRDDGDVWTEAVATGEIIDTAASWWPRNFDSKTEQYPVSKKYHFYSYCFARKNTDTPNGMVTIAQTSDWSEPQDVYFRPAHKPTLVVEKIKGSGTSLRVTVDKYKYSPVNENPSQWYYSLDGGPGVAFTPDGGGRFRIDGLDYLTKYNVRVWYEYESGVTRAITESYQSTEESATVDISTDPPTLTLSRNSFQPKDGTLDIKIYEPLGTGEPRYNYFTYSIRGIDGEFTYNWASNPAYDSSSSIWDATIDLDSFDTLGVYFIAVRAYYKDYNFTPFDPYDDRYRETNSRTLILQSPTRVGVVVDYDPESPTSVAEIELTSNGHGGTCELVSYHVDYAETEIGGSLLGNRKPFFRSPADHNETDLVKFLDFSVENYINYEFYVRAFYEWNGATFTTLESKASIAADNSIEYSFSEYDTRAISEYPLNYWNADLAVNIQKQGTVVKKKYYTSLTSRGGKLYHGEYDESPGFPIVYGSSSSFSPDSNFVDRGSVVFTLNLSKLLGPMPNPDPMEWHVLK